MTKALVIVDVQRDFVEGGSLAIAGGQVVADSLGRLVEIGGYDAILLTQDWHIEPGDHFSETPDYIDSWPVHCKAYTDGAEFANHDLDWFADPAFLFRKGQYKASYSGAEGVNEMGDGLLDVTQQLGVEEVDVVGLAFDYCVTATAVDLDAAGHKVRVLKDYTASVHPESDVDQTTYLASKGVEVV